jgi:alkanesulfonate monooxygenase SsuD/methylene tetrahydromethanopterin reductase-like flavin-dependent oxidoreductase (luciferase family)
MQIGVQQVFQSFGYDPPISDAQVFDEELHLALLAEELGFDSLWPVEHHFTDYAFCPDNVVYLAHVAARTRRIKLGTGAVILPWNTPVRVAEKISMLDHLAGGRVLLGMGRGLARCEYDGLGIPMSEARGRFDEAAEMVLDALTTGVMKGAGPFYPQEAVAIRPAPTRPFRDRAYGVAMSPDSVLSVAELGLRMVVFMQRSPEATAASFEEYGRRYREVHGEEAPPPVVCQFVYCDPDPGRCRDEGAGHVLGYLRSVVEHYELAGDHFAHERGYESYRDSAAVLRAQGQEKLAEVYLSVQACGTPDELIEQTRQLRELMGPYDVSCCFRFAGVPLDVAERSMRLYAASVAPAIRSLNGAL